MQCAGANHFLPPPWRDPGLLLRKPTSTIVNIRKIVEQHPLVSYIAVNYAISWTFLLPAYRLILAAHGSFPPLALFGLIGSCGPSIAAVIVLWLTEGRGGVMS